MGIRLYTSFVPDHLTGTVYRDKYSNKPAGYFHCDNVQVFSSVLKSLHSWFVNNKEANFLIPPAIFDPNHPNKEGNKQRGPKNVRYLRHIWFDFENGELQPNEIPELFPLNQMIIFNTYSHTVDNPRFRVIFPTSQRLTSDAYEVVWDNVAAKLRDASYWVGNKTSGLREAFGHQAWMIPRGLPPAFSMLRVRRGMQPIASSSITTKCSAIVRSSSLDRQQRRTISSTVHPQRQTFQ